MLRLDWKKLSDDKHSSLFRKINAQKSFITLGPGYTCTRAEVTSTAGLQNWSNHYGRKKFYDMGNLNWSQINFGGYLLAHFGKLDRFKKCSWAHIR